MSHNNMATFFSGTDTNTLREEGNDRNCFVSLIVNNAGTYSAGITRKATIIQNITQQSIYAGFNNIVTTVDSTFNIDSVEIHWYDLKVITNRQEIVNSEIDTILEEIRAKKASNTVYSGINNYSSYIYPPSYSGFDFQGKNDPYDFKENYLETEKFENTFTKNTILKTGGNQLNLNLEEDAYERIPYGKVGFDKQIIDLVVKQMLSGNITISETDNKTLFQYAKESEKAFKNRFGNLKFFKEWADAYVEFIITSTWDSNLLNFEEDGMASICAYDVKTILKTLPSNIFIAEYIKMLDYYII